MTLFNVNDLRATLLRHCPLIADISLLPSQQYIRIETGMLYPDGSSIDVFLHEEIGGYELTDLAQTTAWLLNLQIKPWQSKKRQQFLDNALGTYGASRRDGELVLRVHRPEEISDGVLRLAQTCLRVADLMYTRRTMSLSSFNDLVEEIIADTELPYEPEYTLNGAYGNLVTVNFLVMGRRQSAVLTLSGQSPSQSHTPAIEVFRKWHDLETTWPHQKITVLDDRVTYRDEDIQRIARLSTVMPFSNREQIQQALAA